MTLNERVSFLEEKVKRLKKDNEMTDTEFDLIWDSLERIRNMLDILFRRINETDKS